MPRFEVLVPIVGSAYAEVEAETEGEALEAFYSQWDEDENLVDVSWEFVDQVTRGNVCYAPLNEVEITQLDDDNE